MWPRETRCRPPPPPPASAAPCRTRPCGWRIARPALAADVLVEPAVAVGDDVQPRHFLFPQIHRQRVDILLAEPRDHHRVEERPVPQVFRIPARPRQRARDRRRQNLSRSRFQHVVCSLVNAQRPNTTFGNDSALELEVGGWELSVFASFANVDCTSRRPWSKRRRTEETASQEERSQRRRTEDKPFDWSARAARRQP